MANQKTKNNLILDHDDRYIPVVRQTTGEIQSSASFNLAEQNRRSRDRLKQLIDFIQCNQQGFPQRLQSGESVGVSHRLAAQIVYLAYWENYPLEFRIKSEGDIVIRAAFPKQPELTIILDVFKRGTDPFSEIQGWWNFRCELISAHAGIWNIPPVLDESLQRDLMPGDFPRVLVDIVPERASSKQPRGTAGVA